MAAPLFLWLASGALLACSGSDAAPQRPRPETLEVLPLTGADAGRAAFVAFVDEATGFQTSDVHDATREVVRFDAALAAMVSPDGSAAVSGWTSTGNELSWSASRVPFRVSFGTEQGERRAFFTEAGTGTICDLRLYGPEQLGISGTREYPPNP
jgi:hypothetical protein